MNFKVKIQKKINELYADTIFIHIGKCAGSTVRSEFRKKEVEFFEKHMTQVSFNKRKGYIITIRNPISRFVSAFNWRYKLVVEDRVQANRFKGEKRILEKFKTANDLAEQIYHQDGTLAIDLKSDEFYIHHIKEDINFYIGNFLTKCKRENIKAVLVTETLNDDLSNHFNIIVKGHLKSNKRDTRLSQLAIKNLVKYLNDDYRCIERLNEMGVLTEVQYKKLSETSM